MADRRSFWRWAQLLLALVVIVIAVRRLSREWDAAQNVPVTWQVSPVWLVLALLIVWSSYAVLVEGWRRVVLAMKQRLGYLDAVRITMVSNLGKYLPGKVWAIAGAALLAERAGVAPGAAVAAAFLLQALSLASGLLLVAFLAPQAMTTLDPSPRIALAVIAVLALGGLVVFAVPSLLAMFRRWLPKAISGIEPVPVGALLTGLLANVVGWAAYGLAFLCLIRGLIPAAQVSWSLATAVFTTSYLVGLIAAFSPGGIGTRELAFTFLLTPTVGAQAATALAIATRVLLTITELGAALPFLPAMRRTPRTP
ncbi:MAG: lysylphosphatidylglycerol synthase domain-containing protein [Gemmatimonadales bacterium]